MDRILVVDDDRAFRRLLVSQLTARAYEVVEADDGVDAISVMERSAVDVLLLDLKMPWLSGERVLETLATCRPESLRCVIVISSSEKELAAAAEHPLVHCTVQKPVKESDVVNALDSCPRCARPH